jgi:hypothetical protein
MTDHPITPPPSELVLQWIGEHFDCTAGGELSDLERFLTTRAAQYGADQELEACCEWLKTKHWIEPEFSDELRATRRPTPLSAVAQAEALIECHEDGWCPSPAQWHVIRDGLAEGRRALEALPE